MFFKTDADRASAEAAKARHDAGEAGGSAASGARNLGAAVVATLAEVTAPADDRKGKKQAQRTRAKAVKAARKDREDASRAAAKAAAHSRKAAKHGRSAADKRAEQAGGTVAALADAAGDKAAAAATTAAGTAKVAGDQLADRVSRSELADKARERAAQARRSAVHAGESLADRAAPLTGSAKEKAGVGAALVGALATAAREKASETRTRALLGVDHGLDVAVPRAQEGVAAVGPKVDHLRDVINEELLPKLQEMLGDVQTGKDRLLTKDEGAVAAITGTPKKRRRKGGVLITLGLLAAAGAGLAWYLNQQQHAATDPWASQAGGADPWASRTPTSAVPETTVTETAVTETTVAETPVAETPVAETTVTETTVTEAPAAAPAATPTDATGESAQPRMLDSEEIDQLGTDEPTATEEQGPGTSPTDDGTPKG